MSTMAAVFGGNTTKAEVREQERRKKQDELGVCRIRRTKGYQRPRTLGSGFVVKDLKIIPGSCHPYCLISSGKVFPKNDCNIESYYLDFRRLESTDLETIKLEDVGAKSTDIFRTSGLVVIPIKPSKKWSEKRSIFDYRPFKVASEGIKSDDDLWCHFIEDHAESFTVECLQLKQSDVPGQYELHEFLEAAPPSAPHKTYAEVIRNRGHRKPYGAVILKRSDNEFKAGGALTFTDNECRNISSVFFPLPLDTPLKLKIDVETMTPREHNTQDRTPASTEEPGGSQNGQHQEACAVPVSSGQTQPTCTGAEAPQALNSIPTEGEVLRLIAASYLRLTQPSSKDDFDSFLAYMKEMRLTITDARVGSLLITVKCDSLQILESLWEDYSSGHLGEVVQRCFVTEEILTKLSLAELKLKTTISEEEYKACKMYLGKDPAKEADETDDDDDSASDDEDQCGSVAVPVEQPIHVHFTDEKNLSQKDEDDDSRTETVDENLKTDTGDGYSVSEIADQCGAVAIPVPEEKPTYFTTPWFLKERYYASSDSGISSASSSRPTSSELGHMYLCKWFEYKVFGFQLPGHHHFPTIAKTELMLIGSRQRPSYAAGHSLAIQTEGHKIDSVSALHSKLG